MKHWRRAVLAVLVASSMALGGSALANDRSGDHRQDGDNPPSQPTAPPETDPTCESAESEECPGDNGEGSGTATAPCNAGTELARDILFKGAEDGNECE